KIPVGARLMSSPDAVAGLRPDATLMYSNPAFLSGLPRAQAFVSTAEWLDDLVFSAAGVGLPLGDGSTVLGFGTTFLYSGGLKGYNDALAVVSEERYYSAGFDATVSHTFRGTGLSLAAGATYLREHVYPQTGSGHAFHAGAAYWRGPNLVHLSARDLGSSVSYDAGTWEVAPELVIGGGRIFDSRVGQFFAGAQVANSDGYGTRVQMGVDYQVNTFFTLRSGVSNNLDIGESIPFNAGFGLNYGAVAMEYAYTPQEYFSSTHTFSLSYSFGTESRGAGFPATVPAGDFAPPVAASEPVPPPPPIPAVKATARASACVLVAGSHAWLESARAEARALELLKIPARVESDGTRFRVVVGRYDSVGAAEKAQAQYRSLGHSFHVVTE
ncbi:MAG TPA: SPOR domain-containing protein, partial [Candidatus Krumholzibacteria bacterium]|nr:SPOR domain-containing protein [Candidatus Krumholzibacteria bacterium]